MRVNGRCHCGAIRYSGEVDPERVAICHCTDCQTLSGSAYRPAVVAPRDTFEIEGIEPAIYVKTADSGNRRAHAFCPRCGTPVYSCATEDPPWYTLRVGCLEQRAELRPRFGIWCDSALDWSSDLAGMQTIARQPDRG
jgi:hypothetical protein